MAYSAPVVTRIPGAGLSRDMYVVTISGTSLAPADEIAIEGLPKTGRLLGIKSLGSAAGGGAANASATLGTSTNPAAGVDLIFKASATSIGTLLNSYPAGGSIPYYSSGGYLFYRGTVDTGTFSESVVIYFMEGWRD